MPHGRPFPFFCSAPATSAIYTLTLHDALPIWASASLSGVGFPGPASRASSALIVSTARSGKARSFGSRAAYCSASASRSEEHTSELQSRENLVCRLLLEKKKQTT